MPYRSTQLQGVTDLTLLAPIKQRFIDDTFDSESHRTRLEKVLTVLNLVRQASRESEIQPSPFADSIGRFRSIHFFRFAVVPPVADAAIPPPAHSRDQLLLNVTFDGGWEPYMRLVWGPLGTLLDLIFCHCEGYVLACDSTFEDYMRWVRKNEVQAQFFYADSAATVADTHYLGELAQRQRAQGGNAGIERELAELALPLTPQPPIATPHAVAAAMRVLRSVHRLRPLFPGDGIDSQGAILLRFAHELLRDLRGWVQEGRFDPGAEFAAVRQNGDKDALKWLMKPLPVQDHDAPLHVFDAKAVQPGIASPHSVDDRSMTHGGLWLLRVADGQAAIDWLERFQFAPTRLVCPNLAITFTGLRALGVPEHRLALLPQEFQDGMEARAGTLGDVRSSHPRYWTRPRTIDNQVVELGTVHVLLQLRTVLEAGEPDPADGSLLPRLKAHADALLGACGFEVVHVEPMRSHNPLPAGHSQRRGHFGFVDGLSQPQLGNAPRAPVHWSDQIGPGELFLGHPVLADLQPSHGTPARPPTAATDTLLNNASFLVVRKLQQHGDRLEAVLDAAADQVPPEMAARFKDEIKARMMGRRQDGQSLVSPMGSSGANDFSYRHDAGGLHCPHASHVRRANPREAQRGMPLPRIVRRGMSYGPSNPQGQPDDGKDRGLVFMCYASRIAEQFEVIQRWLAGGNASGVSSDQSDPFLGVPTPGRSRVFACEVDGKLTRVDLGDQTLVTLRWGLYALAPSPAALAQWRRIVGSEPPARDSSPAQRQPAQEPPWSLLLDDINTRRAAWTRLRDGEHDGLCDARPYGVLVARPDLVEEVLADKGALFSVCEYGQRMRDSLGEGYLGQDEQGRANRARFAEKVNQAIENFSPAKQPHALTAAQHIAEAVLARLWLRASSSYPDEPPSIDLRELATGVLGLLCQQWFGLPDAAATHMALGGGSEDPHAPPQCPGHFLRISRYVFSASPPRAKVEALGQTQGKSVLRAVEQWLHDGAAKRGDLARAILEVVDKEHQATTLAGIMLGFPPTTMGNLVGVLARWTGTRQLWDLQREWLYRGPDAARWPWLRQQVLASMAKDSVPYALPRTVARDNVWQKLPLKKGDRVIVALGAAGAAGAVSDDQTWLMFGGARDAQRTYAHACPGSELALQVMQGVVAALFEFGSLRPGMAPLTLLAPDKPPDPPPR